MAEVPTPRACGVRGGSFHPLAVGPARPERRIPHSRAALRLLSTYYVSTPPYVPGAEGCPASISAQCFLQL